jgi:hypothetical protein
MILTGETRRTRRKTYPSATLPVTNPTWTVPEANPGFRGKAQATNRLSYGTALEECLTVAGDLCKNQFENTEVSKGFLDLNDVENKFRLFNLESIILIYILILWGIKGLLICAMRMRTFM